ncbi:MAG: CDP-glycerol glycerophosphotransferase family protein [bacterium]
MKISAIVRKTYMYLCYVTRPRKEKTVYFASFRGQYSDNPRAISECLHHMAPDVKIVWLIKPKFKQYVPDYVIAVSPTPRLALKAQARASVWVMNYTYRKQFGVYKSHDTFYIQTWHGDRGVKAIGYLSKNINEKNLIGPDMSACDLFVAASDYGVRKARQGLLYEGEIIVEGMPRNDKLVNFDKYNNEADKIRKTLGVSSDVKVVLYAPTYRDENRNQQCAIDIASTLASLETSGERWVCMIRSHSHSKGIIMDSNSTSYLDVTSYPDMADLLLIADLLITDYSSCAGDFLLTGRPLVLVHFDRKDYESQDRNLWVNPEETGYLVAKNQEELNNILSHLYSYDHQAIADKVNSFYGTKETGQSSEAVAQRILKELNSK